MYPTRPDRESPTAIVAERPFSLFLNPGWFLTPLDFDLGAANEFGKLVAQAALSESTLVGVTTRSTELP
jgi:hypothetical protein